MPAEWLVALYPLGYLSTAAFALRFIIQWLYSESKGQSVVTKSFWSISLLGNVLLFVHSLVQMQFPITFMQAINGVISWRNLNLMGPESGKKSFRTTCLLMGGLALLVALVYLFALPFWFRVPDPTLNISWGWHLWGSIGIFLFASRFFVQWLETEKQKKSLLGPAFWWLSLIGGLLSSHYFALIHDPVNFIGPAIGTIIYIRNLMLLNRQVKLS